MGRYTSSVTGTATEMTAEFANSNSVTNADGFLTSYVANNIAYSNITYVTDSGVAASYGGEYQKVSAWTEVNNLTNESQTITVNYDATTGEVSSLSIA
jgi:hypothetical protein|tara:strand:- start:107 stop:400 length:294 start_codon:yes stop_codon:yes gene_type:complete